MRWLISILCIYMLALSVCPCLDSYEPKSLEAMQTEYNEAHEHTTHSDICSPLCVCACCGSMTASPLWLGAYVTRGQFVLNKQLKRTTSEDHLIPSYLSSIWHPPQIRL